MADDEDPADAPDDAPAGADDRFRRRPLGPAWWIAALMVPLLLAVIGYGVAHRSGSDETPALPTLTQTAPPSAPVPGLSLVTVIRDGNKISLQGELPSDAAKRALLDAVAAAVPGVDILDTLETNPDVTALDFAKSGPVFAAAAPIGDFSLAVTGRTVTLAGTAASRAEAQAVEAAAIAAWPEVAIVDTMSVAGAAPAPATPRRDGPR